MARRTVIDPVRMREQAARQLRTLLQRYDTAEFEAQRHAATMVDILAGFAMDVTQTAPFRAECAGRVLDRAYGTVAQKAQLQLVDPTAVDPERPAAGTIGAQMEAVKTTSRNLALVDDMVARGVPPDRWPPEVRAANEELAALYSEVEE